MKSPLISKVRKWLGLIVFWGLLYTCVFGFPSELNGLLRVSEVSAGAKLNGPNDMTMLIRLVVGLVLGVAAQVFFADGIWQALSCLSSKIMQLSESVPKRSLSSGGDLGTSVARRSAILALCLQELEWPGRNYRN